MKNNNSPVSVSPDDLLPILEQKIANDAQRVVEETHSREKVRAGRLEALSGLLAHGITEIDMNNPKVEHIHHVLTANYRDAFYVGLPQDISSYKQKGPEGDAAKEKRNNKKQSGSDERFAYKFAFEDLCTMASVIQAQRAHEAAAPSQNGHANGNGHAKKHAARPPVAPLSR